MEFDEEYDEVVERKVSGLISWVVDEVCSDIYREEKMKSEDEYSSSTGTDIQNAIDDYEETAPENERIAFYRQVRKAEYNHVKEAMERERDRKMEVVRCTPSDEEFQENIEGFTQCAIDTSCRDEDKEDMYKVEKMATELQDDMNVETKFDNLPGTSEITEKAIDEETASEEERVAYFTKVREAEYSKLVEAMERERIRKEKRIAKKKQREELAKQIEDFFDVDDTDDILKPKLKMEVTHIDMQQTFSYETPSTSEDETCYTLYSHVKFEEEDLQSFSSAKVQQEYIVNPFEHRLFADNTLPTGPIKDGLSVRSTSEPLMKKKSMKYLAKKLFKKRKTKMNDDPNIKLPVNIGEPTTDPECQQETMQQENERTSSPMTSESDWHSIDLDDIEEPPRPRLKPFFSEADVLPYLQPFRSNTPVPIRHMVPRESHLLSPIPSETQKQDSRNLLRRIGHWFIKNVLCCCCRGVDVEN